MTKHTKTTKARTTPRRLPHGANDQARAQSVDALESLFVVTDVAAMSMHTAMQQVASRRGVSIGPPPAPISKLLTGFAAVLREKVIMTAALLTPEDRDRLIRLAPRFTQALGTNAPDLVKLVGGLVQLAPDLIALWLRAHLDLLETRFAP